MSEGHEMRDKTFWLQQLQSGADYRKLAMSCHPDTGRGTHEEFVALQAAKEQMDNPINIFEEILKAHRREEARKQQAYYNDSAYWDQRAKENADRAERERNDWQSKFWKMANEAKKAKARYATGKSRNNFNYAETNFSQFDDLVERMAQLVRVSSFDSAISRQLNSFRRSQHVMRDWYYGKGNH